MLTLCCYLQEIPFCYFPLNPTTRLQHSHTHIPWAAGRAAALQSHTVPWARHGACRQQRHCRFNPWGSPLHPPSWESGLLQVSAAPSLPRSETSCRTMGLGLLTAPMEISTRQQARSGCCIKWATQRCEGALGRVSRTVQQTFPSPPSFNRLWAMLTRQTGRGASPSSLQLENIDKIKHLIIVTVVDFWQL